MISKRHLTTRTAISLPKHILDACSEQKIRWYPGHMEKSLRNMKERIANDQVGLIVEVRDSRAPLSCMNWRFEQLFNGEGSDSRRDGKKKPSKIFRNGWGDAVGTELSSIARLVVYNKADLVDGSDNPINDSFVSFNPARDATLDIKSAPNWRQMVCKNTKYPVVFASCETRAGIEAIMEHAVNYWVKLHHPTLKSTPSIPYPPLNIMVIGLPNTGKSSLINTLRTSGMVTESLAKCAIVGKNPGQTRHLSSKLKIIDTETIALSSTSTAQANELLHNLKSKGRHEPEAVKFLRKYGVRLKVFVMDSPGLLPPFYSDVHTALKMALLNSIPNAQGLGRGANPIPVAEYLWWRMRERWGIAPQVMSALEMDVFDKSNVSDRVEPILRHLTTLKQKESAYPARGDFKTEDAEVAAVQFLKMWRGGDLYRKIGLFMSGPFSEMEPQAKKLRQRMIRELWKVSIVDDELLDGPEAVDEWFAERYETSTQTEDKVKVGDMLVEWAETVTYSERKKLRKLLRKK